MSRPKLVSLKEFSLLFRACIETITSRSLAQVWWENISRIQKLSKYASKTKLIPQKSANRLNWLYLQNMQYGLLRSTAK